MLSLLNAFGPMLSWDTQQAGVTTNSAGMCKNRKKGGKNSTLHPTFSGKATFPASPKASVSLLFAHASSESSLTLKRLCSERQLLIHGAHCICSTTRCQRQLCLLLAQTKLSARHLSSAGGDEGLILVHAENRVPTGGKCQRADDSPVWTWLWPPFPSFCREQLNSQILLLEEKKRKYLFALANH